MGLDAMISKLFGTSPLIEASSAITYYVVFIIDISRSGTTDLFKDIYGVLVKMLLSGKNYEVTSTKVTLLLPGIVS